MVVATPGKVAVRMTPTPTAVALARDPSELADFTRDPRSGLLVTKTPTPISASKPSRVDILVTPTATPTLTPVPRYFDRFDADAVGHSWVNSYLLALASDYVYACTEAHAMCTEADVSEAEDDPSKAEDVWKNRFTETFETWGMDRIDFVDVTTVLSDTQAVVMSNDDVVIVVFRGTEVKLLDYLTDGGIVMLPIPVWASVLGLTPPPHVHAGFYNAQAQAYSFVKAEIDSHMSDEKTLWLTGHSLGAAIATMVAYNLEKVDGVLVRGVYTFGSPKTGDEIWGGLYHSLRFGASLSNPAGDFPHLNLGDKTHRWVNNADIVPALPPDLSPIGGYYHVGILHHIDHNGEVLGNTPSVIPAPLSVSYPEGDHYGYPTRIYNAMPENFKDEMPPPD